MRVAVYKENGREEIEVRILCGEIDQEVESLEDRIRGMEQRLVGYKEGIEFFVKPDEIIYIETVDNKLFLYMKEQVIEARYKLYQVERLLNMRCFIRCSKSTIINVTKIEALKARENRSLIAIMENKEQVYISRNYAKNLKELLRGSRS